MLPTPSPEWYEARRPHLNKFEAAIQPFWEAYLAKRITHDEYRFAILSESIEYSNSIAPAWEKHGGNMIRKRHVDEEVSKHWGKTLEDIEAVRAKALQ